MTDERKEQTGTGAPQGGTASAEQQITVPLPRDGGATAVQDGEQAAEAERVSPGSAPRADTPGPVPTAPDPEPAPEPDAISTDAGAADAEPEPAPEPHAIPADAVAAEPPPADAVAADAAPVKSAPAASKLTSASAMIAVLVALLGFTLVVQVKNNSADPTLAAARQEDLVRILSDLEAREERLRQDIATLEESQRQLTSGEQGRQAALQEATRRGDELGILAGTLPARGPGLTVRFASSAKPVRAAAILDAVQELRGAGAEAMQISGGDGASARIIASTFFLDANGGVNVGGRRLTGPYTITVIGDPKTMRTALNIPGGVVASVSGDGGNVTIHEHEVVDVTALSKPKDLEHARPVS